MGNKMFYCFLYDLSNQFHIAQIFVFQSVHPLEEQTLPVGLRISWSEELDFLYFLYFLNLSDKFNDQLGF